MLVLITNSGKSIWSPSKNIGSYECKNARGEKDNKDITCNVAITNTSTAWICVYFSK
jgi:hypothetical protein